MSATKILLTNLPRLLTGVVRGLVAQDTELQIVGEVSIGDVAKAVDSTDANVVAVGVTDAQDVVGLTMLRERHPRLRFLMIDVTGHHATMDEPDGCRRQVTEISPAALLAMLRGAPG